jgi:hypothetical protein
VSFLVFERLPNIWARIKQPLLLVGAALLLWFAGESALYRSGLYYRLVEPWSNAGAVQNSLSLLEQAYRPNAKTILALGDSRVGEGFSPTFAQADGELIFINLAVPGSTPRTWYYLLREVVRRGYRFDAVLVGTLYTPRAFIRMADWSLDPSHQVALIGLRDLVDYPTGTASNAMRSRARMAVLAPSLIMQEDTRQFLEAPWRRLQKLLVERPSYLAAVMTYGGRDESMPPILISPAGEVLDFGDANRAQRALIEGHLQDLNTAIPADAAVANAAYLTIWLQRIAALAREAGARTVLFPLPRGPYREALPAVNGATPVEIALTGVEGAVVLPRDLFNDLERAAYFFDIQHPNRIGREVISGRLGKRMRALLGEKAS